MTNKSKPHDFRPAISDATKKLSENPTIDWPNKKLCLEPIPNTFTISFKGLIVHKGRFGIGTIVEKDGLRAFDVQWIDGKESASVYLREHQIRAKIKEEIKNE